MPKLTALPTLATESQAALAQVRSVLELLTPEQLPEAVAGAEHLRLLARAADRANLGAVAELDWSEAARLAERRLGQLLEAGRAQGTVAVQDNRKPPTNGGRLESPATLEDLGIGWRLAEEAHWLARLSEADWDRLVAEGRTRGNLARSSMAAAAQQWLDIYADAERRRQWQESEAERARTEAGARLRRIRAMAPEPVDPPPLAPPPALRADYELPEEPMVAPVLTNVADDHGALLQAEQLLMAVSSTRRNLDTLADADPVPRSVADAMLWAGLRSAAQGIVAATYRLVEQYDAHLHNDTPLRSV